LSYNAASVARSLTLAAGVTCRRCGGRLEPVMSDIGPTPPVERRASVLPVRSVMTGPSRLRSD
jgi:hypothetical protein